MTSDLKFEHDFVRKHIRNNYADYFNEEEESIDNRVSFGIGWLQIVDSFFSVCQGFSNSDEVEIVQIKEKFGALRIYFRVSSQLNTDIGNVLCGASYMAEHLSARSCEVCGSPGYADYIGSYRRTLCNEHHHIAKEEVRKKEIKKAIKHGKKDQ